MFTPTRTVDAAWVGRLTVVCLLGCGLVAIWGCSVESGGGGRSGDPDLTDATDGADVSGPESDAPDGGPALEVLGDAEAGRLLYHAVTRGCYVCHGDSAQGTALAPGIGAATVGEIRVALESGTDHSGGAQLDFTAQDVADVAAFLQDPDPAGPDLNTNGPDVGSNGLS